jgi:hypothetical protein
MKTTNVSRTWIGIGLSLALVIGCRLPDDQFRIKGTVQFVNVEGGCWRVLGGDGTSYEPVNLATAFRVNGLQVSMILTPAKNVGSYCMVGELVEVVSIEKQ